MKPQHYTTISMNDKFKTIFIMGPLMLLIPIAFLSRLTRNAWITGLIKADAFYKRVTDAARTVEPPAEQQEGDDLARREGEWPDEIMGLALNVQDDSARLMAYAKAGDRTYTIEQLAESLMNAVNPAMRYMHGNPYPEADKATATWLTEAHVLCNDYGITFGPLSLRLLSLRQMLEEFTNAQVPRGKKDSTIQQADAWMRVTEALDEAAPGWQATNSTGSDAAVNAILTLGRSVQADSAVIDVERGYFAARAHTPTQARAWADSYDKQGGHGLIVQMLRGYADLLESQPVRGEQQ
jgi:hypothetical protein